MNPLHERLAVLDDVQAVRFCRHFSGQLFKGLQVSLAEIKAGIPEEIRGLPGFAEAEALTPEQAKTPLPPAEAAAVARATLAHFADDPALAPALAHALDTYRDEELVGDVVLSAGVAISLILVAAATEFTVQIGGVKVVKKAVDLDKVTRFVKAFLEPFGRLFGSRKK